VGISVRFRHSSSLTQSKLCECGCIRPSSWSSFCSKLFICPYSVTFLLSSCNWDSVGPPLREDYTWRHRTSQFSGRQSCFVFQKLCAQFSTLRPAFHSIHIDLLGPYHIRLAMTSFHISKQCRLLLFWAGTTRSVKWLGGWPGFDSRQRLFVVVTSE
jgi:hypothetical protein